MDRRTLLIASTALTAAAVVAAPALASTSPTTIAIDPEETLFARLCDWHVDQMLDGTKDRVITVDRAGFKALYSRNLIDFIPDPEGKMNVPTLLGHLVRVPGTAFD